MTLPAISVRGLGKLYRIGAQRERYSTLRETLAKAAKAPFAALTRAARARKDAETALWALRDVSFDIQPGEVVGVIGRNGAGKSTLLKILTQITYPTEGEVELRGRVASLLEVGTGFHPELTGRENIFLNGAILGMRQVEIKSKFDEIVAFAEVEKFIDTPVKRYSSGMYVRLAFAVAAHLEPEILLVDEVLAVGDMQFQAKCLGKMGDVAKSGRTILFVSHNMAAIDSLCSRAVLLDKGALLKEGPTGDVVRCYMSQQTSTGKSQDLDACRIIDKLRVVKSLTISGSKEASAHQVELGGPIRFAMVLRDGLNLSGLGIGIHVYSSMGQRVFSLNSLQQYSGVIKVQGRTSIVCDVARCILQPGPYSVVLSVVAGSNEVERFDPAGHFDVVGRDIWGTGKLPRVNDGFVLIDADWKVSS